MGCTTTPTEHTARLLHSCDICGTAIAPGQRYQRWRWFSDGETSVVKVHPDCWGLFRDHDYYEWGDDDLGELLTGWMTRPDALEAIGRCKDPAVGAVWLYILGGF
jgi:hypothetical protein